MYTWNHIEFPTTGDINGFGVYAIRNMVTGEEYIGDTWSPFWKRWRAHISKLYYRKDHHCTRLQDAWNAYGPSAFEFIVLESCLTNDAVYGREAFWIEQRHGASQEHLYNSAGPRRKGQTSDGEIRISL